MPALVILFVGLPVAVVVPVVVTDLSRFGVGGVVVAVRPAARGLRREAVPVVIDRAARADEKLRTLQFAAAAVGTTCVAPLSDRTSAGRVCATRAFGFTARPTLTCIKNRLFKKTRCAGAAQPPLNRRSTRRQTAYPSLKKFTGRGSAGKNVNEMREEASGGWKVVL